MTAQDIQRELQDLKNDAAQYRAAWDRIAELCLPSHQSFLGEKSKGDPNTNSIFDSTAYNALNIWVGIMNSINTPQNNKWHKMTVVDEKLASNYNVQIYLDRLTDALFKARYNPMANFNNCMNDRYMSIGAFGNSVTFIDDVVGRHLLYKSIPLYQCYFAENYNGQIDTVFREFKMQARQMEQKFGRDVLPDIVKKSLERNPYAEFPVIHCVKPNANRKVNKKNYEGMSYNDWYVCENAVLSRGGFRTFPYMIGQYYKTPGEVYAYGPAMMAYPEISMINRVREISLIGAEMAILPPILLPDDDVLDSFSLIPGALNRGGLDPAGNPRAKAFEYPYNYHVSEAFIEQSRAQIRSAFSNDLFQILVSTPEMSATEALIRAQEKGALLAPALVMQHSMSTAIQREIDILTNAGVLPIPPKELLDSGGVLQVQYTSNLDKLQKAEEGVAIMRTFQQASAIAQYDPSVMAMFNTEAALKLLNIINGAPAEIIKSSEEIEAMKAAMAQEKQLQQITNIAPQAIDAAKTLAEINNMNKTA